VLACILGPIMDKLLRFLVIALLAVLPMAASAIIVDPYFYAGEARFLPEVRGPNDPIGYKVVIPHPAAP
jgi:hypothetical protein